MRKKVKFKNIKILIFHKNCTFDFTLYIYYFIFQYFSFLQIQKLIILITKNTPKYWL